MTKIGVYGLGYVGAVTVAALADCGHEVVGVDSNPTKVDMINSGKSPVVEIGLDDLLHQGVIGGRIRATNDPSETIRSTEVSIICVGTPSKPNGSLDLTQVEQVCHQIGSALRDTDHPHTVVMRSTMLPGSMATIVIPTLERSSGRVVGQGLGVCINPEFLREGTSIRDFYHPPFTLIGSDDEYTSKLVGEIYSTIDAEVLNVPLAVAEMVKYSSNAFHAIKVAFANEIGSIAKSHGVDSHLVMDVFAKDTKLNVSSAYLRPGYAFGGSCLPKDLRALTYHARSIDVATPLLDSVMVSNTRHIDRAFDLVKATGKKRIGVFGFSFKAGTDDLRESPLVELIERLIGKGFQVGVYDSHVSLARLVGANKAYIEKEIPHISSLMHDRLEDLAASVDVIVIGNSSPEFAGLFDMARPDQTIIDLVRIGSESAAGYTGICW